jgi:hypothetical protein
MVPVYNSIRIAALSLAVTLTVTVSPAAQAFEYHSDDPLIAGAMECTRYLPREEREHAIPSQLLAAISVTETGRWHKRLGMAVPWPWTINADGKGTFYDTEDEAITAATAHLTDGTGTFDIGCFQLNIRWHGEAFATFQEMFDPEQNATYAARFLMQLHAEKGNWADAVSAYHSRNPDLAQAYLNQVKSVLESPPTPSAIPVAAPVIVVNNFPLLQAGLPGGIGSIVPLTSARGPLIGGNF